jgi:hypothetical protein
LKEATPEKGWLEKATAAIKRADVFIIMLGPKNKEGLWGFEGSESGKRSEETQIPDYRIRRWFFGLGCSRGWTHLQLELGEFEEPARLMTAEAGKPP